MTKEEFKSIKVKTRFAELYSDLEDETENLLRELYFAGYQDGYQFAVRILDKLKITATPNIESFFRRNHPKIQNRLEAIRELERSEEEEKSVTTSTQKMFEDFYDKQFMNITHEDLGPGDELDWGEDVEGEKIMGDGSKLNLAELQAGEDGND